MSAAVVLAALLLAPSMGPLVLGRATEGAYRLEPHEQKALKRRVLKMAKSSEFLERAGLRKDRAARRQFFNLLRRTEVVGSRVGGAAGLLQLHANDEHRLRIAIQTYRGPGNLFGLLSEKLTTRHELLHF